MGVGGGLNEGEWGRHLQYFLDVYASGVRATTKCFANLRMSPTPMHGGLPLLHASPGRPATSPHAPYARTSGLLSLMSWSACSLFIKRASLRCVFMYDFHLRLRTLMCL